MNTLKNLDQSLIEVLGLSEITLIKLHVNGIITIGFLEKYFKDGTLEKIFHVEENILDEVSKALIKYHNNKNNSKTEE
jgi:hypothetical protein